MFLFYFKQFNYSDVHTLNTKTYFITNFYVIKTTLIFIYFINNLTFTTFIYKLTAKESTFIQKLYALEKSSPVSNNLDTVSSRSREPFFE